MAQIAKIFAGRVQNILQVAAKQHQLAPRFYSAAGKYKMIDLFIYFFFYCAIMEKFFFMPTTNKLLYR